MLRPVNPTPDHIRAMPALPKQYVNSPPTRHPSRAHVEWVVADEADRAGEPAEAVMGACMLAELVRVRYRAIIRILSESGCSILGLSKVWGVDRKSIQRAIMLARADARLDPYARRAERRRAA